MTLTREAEPVFLRLPARTDTQVTTQSRLGYYTKLPTGWYTQQRVAPNSAPDTPDGSWEASVEETSGS